MKCYVPLILCIFVLLSACSENTFSVPPAEETPKWNAFNVTQTYYDSLQVTSENRIFLPDRSVQSVVLLTEVFGQYVGRDTAVATYVATNRGYFLNYSLKGKVSNRDVDAAFRIRYEDADGSIAVVDTSEYMLDYPYKDVEVYISVLSLESGTTLRQTDIQDFDLTLNSILFHPLGQAGIYDYRYSELRSEELVGAFSGNYMTILQDHLYYEIVGIRLFKLALQAGAQEQEIDLSSLSFRSIAGLAGWQDKLFILFDEPSGNFLGVFDQDGILLETIDFPRYCFHLAISSNGILYTNFYTDLFEPELLVRFNLNSETFLEDKIHPGYSPNGIRVWGDRLFFTDYQKPIIASMPLSALDD